MTEAKTLETKAPERAELGARVRVAQTHARAGQRAEAEAAWRDILETHPDSLPAVNGLISLLETRDERTEAEAILRRFVAAAPTPPNIAAAARHWERWQDGPRAGAKTLRLALTGTGTLAPLGVHLRVACAQIGLHPAVYVGEFGQWAQEWLPPDSPLYAFGPELIALLLEPMALFPKNLGDGDATAAERNAERQDGLSHIRALLLAARRNAPTATLLLHTFALPDYAPLGILDAKAEDGQRARFAAVNAALAALVRDEFPQVVLLDQERVEARHGKARVRDERLWFLASMPFSETFLPTLAAEYLRVIRPLKGLTRKCLVLDLDNTLWGGVIGEDGPAQIKLGGTAAPGNAFYEFQRALDALQRRGVLLALCSKNNPDDVWPVLEDHPHMVLRRAQFAAVRVNWQDKAANIVEIARELNIGLDSLVFLDDNPAERGLIRQQLPDVLTVELPRDPAFYVQTLRGLDVFETLALTGEDQKRSQLYQEQQERAQFQESIGEAGDLTAYLSGLQITAEIAFATPFTLPRIAQLINKTNQFNLTTRRYAEPQVQAMADAPDNWGVWAITVGDRFGDSGLTGVALVRKGGDIWDIDSFLLSCRVLGRGIEDALLTFVIKQARAAGASRLHGHFLPTAKNAPAAEFYKTQGFVRLASEGESQEWELSLDAPNAERDFPRWLTVTSS